MILGKKNSFQEKKKYSLEEIEHEILLQNGRTKNPFRHQLRSFLP
jgi:hypothetical protein